jgi:hypothetical protein
MAGRREVKRNLVKNYTGEVSALEIRYKILRILLEERERGSVLHAGLRGQHDRDICKGEQG